MPVANLPVPCPPDNSNVPAACLSVIMLDAGQGDATLIVHPDGSLVLVDCGCKKNENIVKGEIAKVLGAYLQRTGNVLKALVLTHPDGDHYNLVNELIVQKGIKIGTLIYGGISKHYTGLTGWISNYLLQRPQQITMVRSLNYNTYLLDPVPALSSTGGPLAPPVDVRILAANAGQKWVRTDANPNSVVLLVTFLDINIFLMGDATTLTENFILGWDQTSGGALTNLINRGRTVLKVGHHGSETSSGSDWLNKIRPEIVLISSDTKTFNGTSIPRKTVIDRILGGPVADLNGVHPNHYYVEYDSTTQLHQQVDTSRAICTTLHLLQFKPNSLEFKAYGTSWYYTVTAALTSGAWTRGNVFLTPAVGWDAIKKTDD